MRRFWFMGVDMAIRELNKMPAGSEPPASTIGKPTKASTYRAASVPTGRRRYKRPVGTPVRVGRHVVGYVRGDTFYKVLQPGHFLRKPPAICFDVSSLTDAAALGARKAHVTNSKTGQVYQAAFSTIHARGFPVRRVSEQVGLELLYWQTGGGQLAEQLSLFGDAN